MIRILTRSHLVFLMSILHCFCRIGDLKLDANRDGMYKIIKAVFDFCLCVP